MMQVAHIVPVSGRITPQPDSNQPMEQTNAPVQDLPSSGIDEKDISSEELFEKIKEIAQDGQYSVRFEMNDDVKDLVIKVVSRQSGKVVRQIPSEELINISKTLRDLRGLIVDTSS